MDASSDVCLRQRRRRRLCAILLLIWILFSCCSKTIVSWMYSNLVRQPLLVRYCQCLFDADDIQYTHFIVYCELWIILQWCVVHVIVKQQVLLFFHWLCASGVTKEKKLRIDGKLNFKKDSSKKNNTISTTLVYYTPQTGTSSTRESKVRFNARAGGCEFLLISIFFKSRRFKNYFFEFSRRGIYRNH